MHELISYLLKLSISLAVVWLFYQFVLRRLTFYNSNRWYLLGYTALSFLIPFINISSIFNGGSAASNDFIQLIPSVHQYTIALEEASQCPVPIWSTNYDKWDWVAFALIAGAAILVIRFLIRYISFVRIRNKAELISDDDIKIYRVDDSIIPFSFGNAVFINCDQHSSEELEEIIRHEFVHVRQKHTIDIIWAELLCILNWYNPFVWMIKKSIRQNLEFIADNKVVENGIDKKQYQYLLLKVIGNSQFSIATQFNFSSLKKRIAMMNKTKSAKRQMLRMLFLLPATAVLLLAFRNKMDEFKNQDQEQPPVKIREATTRDTVPEVKSPNSKGYIINIKDKSGECELVIKDKNKKEVKRLLLTEWNEKAEYYENLYGEIPLPPPPPLPVKAGQPTQPPVPSVPIKAGKPGEPAQPPVPPTPPTKVIGVKHKNGVSADFDLNNDVITVKSKDGTKEVFDLKNEKEKKQFIEKYGDPVIVSDISTSVNSNINTKVTSVLATTLKSNIVANNNINAVNVTNTNVDAKIATDNVMNVKLATTVSSPVVVNASNNISTTVEPVIVTSANVNVDIIITISKNTTLDELDKLITKMKEKGYELKFTNKNYNDKLLTGIAGTIKYKDSNSSFSVTDFNNLSIAVFRDGDNVNFKILTDIKKPVI